MTTDKFDEVIMNRLKSKDFAKGSSARDFARVVLILVLIFAFVCGVQILNQVIGGAV